MHVTYPNLDDTKATDRPATKEIEITPAMVSAGVLAFDLYSLDPYSVGYDCRADCVRDIYQAMALAKGQADLSAQP